MTFFIESKMFLRDDDLQRVEETLQKKVGNQDKVILLPLGLELKNPRIAFKCDRTKCMNCNESCSHTFDIEHAANFKRMGEFSEYWEETDD